MSKEETKDKNEETQGANNEEGAPNVDAAPLKGILGTKIGMTRIFVSDTEMVPVTVISADGNIVSQVKTLENDGYAAVQVGYENVAERKLNKPDVQRFVKKGLTVKRHTMEFRVADAAPFKTGQTVPVTVFEKGDWVQVSGLTKGKGFTGTIKRYGFGGGPHSHGHGEYRRAPGSSGGQGPQHVLPGTRKPGHKGHVMQTMPTVQVVEVDTGRNLILVRGSVPGPNGNLVFIRPASKKKGQAKDAGKAKGKK